LRGPAKVEDIVSFGCEYNQRSSRGRTCELNGVIGPLA
jgi:hypothetical protein